MDAKAGMNPAAAAQILGVNSHTIRRWCADHAAYLSAGANPDKGLARSLTTRDMEVLRTVQTLRNQGLLTPAINDRLANLTFAEVVKEDTNPTNPIVEQENDVISHPDTLEEPRQAPAAVMAMDTFNALQTRLDTLERLETRIREDRRNALYYVGIGIVIGLLLALMFFAGGAFMLGR